MGDVVFKAEGLTGKGFKDISFEVRAGEIVGLSGLVGSGRSETMRAIFGLDPLYSGKMYLNGQEIKIRRPSNAINKGIVMINEDRKNYGLCLFRSIRENISLPNLRARQKGVLLNQRK
jgi:ribose transport system ATP-binding protein/inositol transport system ATP-binding protein